MTPPVARHAAAELVAYADALLVRAGVRSDIARTTATILVEGDLLGHTTHGLALLPAYLAELDRGAMARSGEPAVLHARPATQTWDGQRLPGPWTTVKAVDTAVTMAETQGTGTVVIRRSHHIACLAAYLKRATDRGYALLLTCSDPSACSVAPFGAVSPVFTPNPLAAGFPTSGDPVLLDISASLTTNGLTNRLHAAGEKLPHAWLQDAEGRPTNDPAVLFDEPKGTLLPLGGHDAGHKGFALALLVEALTAGLAGFGRADPDAGWGATVFVQALDPMSFGGREAFVRQMDWLVEACHAARPLPGTRGARMPGERGQALARDQAKVGIALHPTILPALTEWGARYSVPSPAALA
jgi:LDH2 family malate/lactate/ureidoglycolate dehydrogenase